jgi:hypothetical protein
MAKITSFLYLGVISAYHELTLKNAHAPWTGAVFVLIKNPTLTTAV